MFQYRLHRRIHRHRHDDVSFDIIVFLTTLKYQQKDFLSSIDMQRLYILSV